MNGRKNSERFNPRMSRGSDAFLSTQFTLVDVPYGRQCAASTMVGEYSDIVFKA